MARNGKLCNLDHFITIVVTEWPPEIWGRSPGMVMRDDGIIEYDETLIFRGTSKECQDIMGNIRASVSAAPIAEMITDKVSKVPKLPEGTVIS